MLSLPPDPYEALGIPHDADISTIKKAFRKRVLRCHPDRPQDESLRPQLIEEYYKVQQAYDLLSDDSERRHYDDLVKLEQLRKERLARASSNIAEQREARISPYYVRRADRDKEEWRSRYYEDYDYYPRSRESKIPADEERLRQYYKSLFRRNEVERRQFNEEHQAKTADSGLNRHYERLTRHFDAMERRATKEVARRRRELIVTTEDITPNGRTYHMEQEMKSAEDYVMRMDKKSSRNPDHNSSPGRSPYATTESTRETTTVYEIPIVLSENKKVLQREGQQVNALGDYCAKFNFIREDFAARLGLKINRTSRESVKIGGGNKINTVGTTTLSPFRFQDEQELHSPVFHVIPKCLHTIILGRPFLKATQTFSLLSNFVRRVKQRMLHSFAYHLLYLGDSLPRFTGLLNGKPNEALADSGAKVLVMDEEFAQRNNIFINRGAKHRITLRFADDSTAETSGMVHGVEWEFGPGGEGKYKLDFHILRNAPADVILSDSFLFGTNAFSRYDCFLVDEDDEDEDAFFFAIDVDKRQRHEGTAESGSTTTHARYIELVLRGQKDDEIANLPLVEQPAALARENARRAAWDRDYARTQQMQTQPTATQSANANSPSAQPTQITVAQKPSQWQRFKLKLKSRPSP